MTLVWTFYHSYFDHARFDLLSHESCAKHSIGVRAFRLSIDLARNLYSLVSKIS